MWHLAGKLSKDWPWLEKKKFFQRIELMLNHSALSCLKKLPRTWSGKSDKVFTNCDSALFHVKHWTISPMKLYPRFDETWFLIILQKLLKVNQLKFYHKEGLAKWNTFKTIWRLRQDLVFRIKLDLKLSLSY